MHAESLHVCNLIGSAARGIPEDVAQLILAANALHGYTAGLMQWLPAVGLSCMLHAASFRSALPPGLHGPSWATATDQAWQLAAQHARPGPASAAGTLYCHAVDCAVACWQARMDRTQGLSIRFMPLHQPAELLGAATANMTALHHTLCTDRMAVQAALQATYDSQANVHPHGLPADFAIAAADIAAHSAVSATSINLEPAHEQHDVIPATPQMAHAGDQGVLLYLALSPHSAAWLHVPLFGAAASASVPPAAAHAIALSAAKLGCSRSIGWHWGEGQSWACMSAAVCAAAGLRAEEPAIAPHAACLVHAPGAWPTDATALGARACATQVLALRAGGAAPSCSGSSAAGCCSARVPLATVSREVVCTCAHIRLAAPARGQVLVCRAGKQIAVAELRAAWPGTYTVYWQRPGPAHGALRLRAADVLFFEPEDPHRSSSDLPGGALSLQWHPESSSSVQQVAQAAQAHIAASAASSRVPSPAPDALAGIAEHMQVFLPHSGPDAQRLVLMQSPADTMHIQPSRSDQGGQLLHIGFSVHGARAVVLPDTAQVVAWQGARSALADLPAAAPSAQSASSGPAASLGMAVVTAALATRDAAASILHLHGLGYAIHSHAWPQVALLLRAWLAADWSRVPDTVRVPATSSSTQRCSIERLLQDVQADGDGECAELAVLLGAACAAVMLAQPGDTPACAAAMQVLAALRPALSTTLAWNQAWLAAGQPHWWHDDVALVHAAAAYLPCLPPTLWRMVGMCSGAWTAVPACLAASLGGSLASAAAPAHADAWLSATMHLLRCAREQRGGERGPAGFIEHIVRALAATSTALPVHGSRVAGAPSLARLPHAVHAVAAVLWADSLPTQYNEPLLVRGQAALDLVQALEAEGAGPGPGTLGHAVAQVLPAALLRLQGAFEAGSTWVHALTPADLTKPSAPRTDRAVPSFTCTLSPANTFKHGLPMLCVQDACAYLAKQTELPGEARGATPWWLTLLALPEQRDTTLLVEWMSESHADADWDVLLMGVHPPPSPELPSLSPGFDTPTRPRAALPGAANNMETPPDRIFSVAYGPDASPPSSHSSKVDGRTWRAALPQPGQLALSGSILHLQHRAQQLTCRQYTLLGEELGVPASSSSSLHAWVLQYAQGWPAMVVRMRPGWSVKAAGPQLRVSAWLPASALAGATQLAGPEPLPSSAAARRAVSSPTAVRAAIVQTALAGALPSDQEPWWALGSALARAQAVPTADSSPVLQHPQGSPLRGVNAASIPPLAPAPLALPPAVAAGTAQYSSGPDSGRAGLDDAQGWESGVGSSDDARGAGALPLSVERKRPGLSRAPAPARVLPMAEMPGRASAGVLNTPERSPASHVQASPARSESSIMAASASPLLTPDRQVLSPPRAPLDEPQLSSSPSQRRSSPASSPSRPSPLLGDDDVTTAALAQFWAGSAILANPMSALRLPMQSHSAAAWLFAEAFIAIMPGKAMSHGTAVAVLATLRELDEHARAWQLDRTQLLHAEHASAAGLWAGLLQALARHKSPRAMRSVLTCLPAEEDILVQEAERGAAAAILWLSGEMSSAVQHFTELMRWLDAPAGPGSHSAPPTPPEPVLDAFIAARRVRRWIRDASRRAASDTKAIEKLARGVLDRVACVMFCTQFDQLTPLPASQLAGDCLQFLTCQAISTASLQRARGRCAWLQSACVQRLQDALRACASSALPGMSKANACLSALRAVEHADTMTAPPAAGYSLSAVQRVPGLARMQLVPALLEQAQALQPHDSVTLCTAVTRLASADTLHAIVQAGPLGQALVGQLVSAPSAPLPQHARLLQHCWASNCWHWLGGDALWQPLACQLHQLMLVDVTSACSVRSSQGLQAPSVLLRHFQHASPHCLQASRWKPRAAAAIAAAGFEDQDVPALTRTSHHNNAQYTAFLCCTPAGPADRAPQPGEIVQHVHAALAQADAAAELAGAAQLVLRVPTTALLPAAPCIAELAAWTPETAQWYWQRVAALHAQDPPPVHSLSKPAAATVQACISDVDSSSVSSSACTAAAQRAAVLGAGFAHDMPVKWVHPKAFVELALPALPHAALFSVELLTTNLDTAPPKEICVMVSPFARDAEAQAAASMLSDVDPAGLAWPWSVALRVRLPRSRGWAPLLTEEAVRPLLSSCFPGWANDTSLPSVRRVRVGFLASLGSAANVQFTSVRVCMRPHAAAASQQRSGIQMCSLFSAVTRCEAGWASLLHALPAALQARQAHPASFWAAMLRACQQVAQHGPAQGAAAQVQACCDALRETSVYRGVAWHAALLLASEVAERAACARAVLSSLLGWPACHRDHDWESALLLASSMALRGAQQASDITAMLRDPRSRAAVLLHCLYAASAAEPRAAQLPGMHDVALALRRQVRQGAADLGLWRHIRAISPSMQLAWHSMALPSAALQAAWAGLLAACAASWDASHSTGLCVWHTLAPPAPDPRALLVGSHMLRSLWQDHHGPATAWTVVQAAVPTLLAQRAHRAAPAARLQDLVAQVLPRMWQAWKAGPRVTLSDVEHCAWMLLGSVGSCGAELCDEVLACGVEADAAGGTAGHAAQHSGTLRADPGAGQLSLAVPPTVPLRSVVSVPFVHLLVKEVQRPPGRAGWQAVQASLSLLHERRRQEANITLYTSAGSMAEDVAELHAPITAAPHASTAAHILVLPAFLPLPGQERLARQELTRQWTRHVSAHTAALVIALQSDLGSAAWLGAGGGKLTPATAAWLDETLAALREVEAGVQRAAAPDMAQAVDMEEESKQCAQATGRSIFIALGQSATTLAMQVLDMEQWASELAIGSRVDALLPLGGVWAAGTVIARAPQPFQRWLRVAFDGMPAWCARWVAWEGAVAWSADGEVTRLPCAGQAQAHASAAATRAWGPMELAPRGWVLQQSHQGSVMLAPAYASTPQPVLQTQSIALPLAWQRLVRRGATLWAKRTWLPDSAAAAVVSTPGIAYEQAEQWAAAIAASAPAAGAWAPITACWPTLLADMVYAWAFSLRPGDMVDARDEHGKWYEAVIIAARAGTVVVRYLGWSPESHPGRFDERLPRTSGRVLPLGSKCPVWRRVQVGDECETRDDKTVEMATIVGMPAEGRVWLLDSHGQRLPGSVLLADCFRIAGYATHKRPRFWAIPDEEPVVPLASPSTQLMAIASHELLSTDLDSSPPFCIAAPSEPSDASPARAVAPSLRADARRSPPPALREDSDDDLGPVLRALRLSRAQHPAAGSPPEEHASPSGSAGSPPPGGTLWRLPPSSSTPRTVCAALPVQAQLPSDSEANASTARQALASQRNEFWARVAPRAAVSGSSMAATPPRAEQLDAPQRAPGTDCVLSVCDDTLCLDQYGKGNAVAQLPGLSSALTISAWVRRSATTSPALGGVLFWQPPMPDGWFMHPLHPGTLVEARYGAASWYSGVVEAARAMPTAHGVLYQYQIRYEDGDVSAGLAQHLVRPRGFARQSAAVVLLPDGRVRVTRDVLHLPSAAGPMPTLAHASSVGGIPAGIVPLAPAESRMATPPFMRAASSCCMRGGAPGRQPASGGSPEQGALGLTMASNDAVTSHSALPDAWTHVVASIANGRIALWLNGVLVGEAPAKCSTRAPVLWMNGVPTDGPSFSMDAPSGSSGWEWSSQPVVSPASRAAAAPPAPPPASVGPALPEASGSAAQIFAPPAGFEPGVRLHVRSVRVAQRATHTAEVRAWMLQAATESGLAVPRVPSVLYNATSFQHLRSRMPRIVRVREPGLPPREAMFHEHSSTYASAPLHACAVPAAAAAADRAACAAVAQQLATFWDDADAAGTWAELELSVDVTGLPVLPWQAQPAAAPLQGPLYQAAIAYAREHEDAALSAWHGNTPSLWRAACKFAACLWLQAGMPVQLDMYGCKAAGVVLSESPVAHKLQVRIAAARASRDVPLAATAALFQPCVTPAAGLEPAAVAWRAVPTPMAGTWEDIDWHSIWQYTAPAVQAGAALHHTFAVPVEVTLPGALVSVERHDVFVDTAWVARAAVLTAGVWAGVPLPELRSHIAAMPSSEVLVPLAHFLHAHPRIPMPAPMQALVQQAVSAPAPPVGTYCAHLARLHRELRSLAAAPDGEVPPGTLTRMVHWLTAQGAPVPERALLTLSSIGAAANACSTWLHHTLLRGLDALGASRAAQCLVELITALQTTSHKLAQLWIHVLLRELSARVLRAVANDQSATCPCWVQQVLPALLRPVRVSELVSALQRIPSLRGQNIAARALAAAWQNTAHALTLHKQRRLGQAWPGLLAGLARDWQRSVKQAASMLAGASLLLERLQMRGRTVTDRTAMSADLDGSDAAVASPMPQAQRDEPVHLDALLRLLQQVTSALGSGTAGSAASMGVPSAEEMSSLLVRGVALQRLPQSSLGEDEPDRTSHTSSRASQADSEQAPGELAGADASRADASEQAASPAPFSIAVLPGQPRISHVRRYAASADSIWLQRTMAGWGAWVLPDLDGPACEQVLRPLAGAASAVAQDAELRQPEPKLGSEIALTPALQLHIPPGHNMAVFCVAIDTGPSTDRGAVRVRDRVGLAATGLGRRPSLPRNAPPIPPASSASVTGASGDDSDTDTLSSALLALPTAASTHGEDSSSSDDEGSVRSVGSACSEALASAGTLFSALQTHLSLAPYAPHQQQVTLARTGSSLRRFSAASESSDVPQRSRHGSVTSRRTMVRSGSLDLAEPDVATHMEFVAPAAAAGSLVLTGASSDSDGMLDAECLPGAPARVHYVRVDQAAWWWDFHQPGTDGAKPGTHLATAWRQLRATLSAASQAQWPVVLSAWRRRTSRVLLSAAADAPAPVLHTRGSRLQHSPLLQQLLGSLDLVEQGDELPGPARQHAPLAAVQPQLHHALRAVLALVVLGHCLPQRLDASPDDRLAGTQVTWTAAADAAILRAIDSWHTAQEQADQAMSGNVAAAAHRAARKGRPLFSLQAEACQDDTFDRTLVGDVQHWQVIVQAAQFTAPTDGPTPLPHTLAEAGAVRRAIQQRARLLQAYNALLVAVYPALGPGGPSIGPQLCDALAAPDESRAQQAIQALLQCANLRDVVHSLPSCVLPEVVLRVWARAVAVSRVCVRDIVRTTGTAAQIALLESSGAPDVIALCSVQGAGQWLMSTPVVGSAAASAVTGGIAHRMLGLPSPASHVLPAPVVQAALRNAGSWLDAPAARLTSAAAANQLAGDSDDDGDDDEELAAAAVLLTETGLPGPGPVTNVQLSRWHGGPILPQLVSQTVCDPSTWSAIDARLLRQPRRAWASTFVGEGGQDVGGPWAEAFALATGEMFHGQAALARASGAGTGLAWLAPHDTAQREALESAGALLAAAHRAQLTLAVPLGAAAWHAMVQPQSADPAVRAVMQGWHSVLPLPADLPLPMAGMQLEQLLAGVPGIDVPLLRRHTVYEGYSADDAPIQALWTVLESLNPGDAAAVLRFIWGRDRLPGPGTPWPQCLTIARMPRDDPQNALPQSHTCAFRLDLPEYRDAETLRAKLLTAAHMSGGYDLDGGAHGVLL